MILAPEYNMPTQAVAVASNFKVELANFGVREDQSYPAAPPPRHVQMSDWVAPEALQQGSNIKEVLKSADRQYKTG